MPAKKRPDLAGDELATLRTRIRDAMAEQRLTQKGLAKRIGRKVETVKVYLADADYGTQRQPLDDFLARIERGAGPVVAWRGPGRPPLAALQHGPDLGAVILDFLVRARQVRIRSPGELAPARARPSTTT